MNRTFYAKLRKIWANSNSLLCIGLDSDRGFTFSKKIIDSTYDLVCAYKPNTAFYEAKGARGITELKKTCDYIHQKYSDIVLIVDAKRADIGSTNKGYVSFIFDYLNADAVTLHPYLGQDALQPFLERKEKGSIILCRTSNPGSGEFQSEMYKKVARHVANKWNSNKNCALVVGATYSGELKIVRRIVKDIPILVPGIGAQGGELQRTVINGLDSNGTGMIINASRSIIFAVDPRKEAVKLRDQINEIRKS